jgi:hypothetical protein
MCHLIYLSLEVLVTNFCKSRSQDIAVIKIAAAAVAENPPSFIVSPPLPSYLIAS